MRERLKRLLPNHPSSPLRDDVSRNPFSPDAEAELPSEPALDTTSASQDQVDRGLDAQDKARIDRDGSWHWKGLDLRSEPSRIGEEAFEDFRVLEGRDAEGKYGEHGLTPAMRRIEAQLEHGHLVDETEGFALKSPDRFKEKFAKAILRNPDIAPQELASEIHDAVRYTFIFSDEKYCDGLWKTQTKLSSGGYELEVRRNTWKDLEYKGINTRWRDSASELPFEIQFHTKASWEAKQVTHDAYAKIQNSQTSRAEVRELKAYQREISSKVEIPPEATDIPDYRKKGR